MSALDRDRVRFVMGWWDPEDEAAIDQVETCLIPDPRIAALEQLLTDLETPGTSFGAAKRLRAILRGDA